MSDETSHLAGAATEFHEEVPHEYQVSISMGMETRERLSAIRDELNDSVGSDEFTTDDAMRLALVAAARYDALVAGDAEVGAVDREQLGPLTGAVRRAVAPDDRVPDP
jgi:hypothetical protein